MLTFTVPRQAFIDCRLDELHGFLYILVCLTLDFGIVLFARSRVIRDASLSHQIRVGFRLLNSADPFGILNQY